MEKIETLLSALKDKIDVNYREYMDTRTDVRVLQERMQQLEIQLIKDIQPKLNRAYFVTSALGLAVVAIAGLFNGAFNFLVK
jgi:hypothetical protein